MGTKKNTKALTQKEGVDKVASLSKDSVAIIKKKRKDVKTVSSLVNDILKGNKTALSQGITIIESTATKHQQQAKQLIEACLPSANNSIRIGITGVPGVGKSTFIEYFGKLLISKNYKVAVLTVDPSSTVSKGSILGDKTRMEQLVKEQNAFIRPSASGASLGGVARKTREAIILCEAAGYDCILIETVGVGQSETTVHSMTDFFLLLKLAGAGDELQGIKRGIIEMADAIVITKADGNNTKAAQLAKTEFNRALHLYPPKDSGWTPKAITCSAITNSGIVDVYQLIDDYFLQTKATSYFKEKRNLQDQLWFRQTIEEAIHRSFFEDETVKKELEIQLKKIENRKITPFEAAQNMLQFK